MPQPDHPPCLPYVTAPLARTHRYVWRYAVKAVLPHHRAVEALKAKQEGGSGGEVARATYIFERAHNTVSVVYPLHSLPPSLFRLPRCYALPPNTVSIPAHCPTPNKQPPPPPPTPHAPPPYSSIRDTHTLTQGSEKDERRMQGVHRGCVLSVYSSASDCGAQSKIAAIPPLPSRLMTCVE
jgi:hypothetical protein